MLTIKQAAELTGLTAKGLRHYESLGLCHASARTEAGYRMYAPEELDRLRRIRHYRDMKFSLREIAELLDMAPEDTVAALEQQLHLVETELDEYSRARAALKALLGNESARPGAQLAIIGIDLQNDILPGGALPCRRIELLLEPLAALYTEARRRGVPIVYVCDCHRKGDAELVLWNDHMMEGSWGAQIISVLEPKENDYVVPKTRFNGFFNTGLQAVLDSLGVKTLLFTGWRTDVCVAQTAIEAFYRGFRVAIARDGVNSTTESEHRAGLSLMQINYSFEMLACAEALDAQLSQT